MPRSTDPTPPRPPGRDEFWGDQAAWSDSPSRHRDAERATSESTTRRWWGALLGSGSTASRTHGVSTRPVALDNDGFPPSPELEEESTVGDTVTEWDDEWDIEPTSPPRSGVDPLLARFGMLAVIITLALPVVMGFTSGDDADQISDLASEVAAAGATTTIADATTGAAPPVGAIVDPVSDPTLATTTMVEAPTSTVADTSSSTKTAAAPAELSAPVATDAPEANPCGAEYELSAGDYWIRIADAADVRLADLLAVNNATIETVLVPGRSICLPAGAQTPAAPSTASRTSPSAPSTTAAPVTTARPATTAPPAPTAPPTTTTKPRPPTVAPADAEAIIRSVWPDDLEAHALEIAWRESNYQSNARNSCCYGLFQIHWNAHKSWLSGIGVTSADQLFDPTTNAQAAYALYQRSGGFGPWGG